MARTRLPGPLGFEQESLRGGVPEGSALDDAFRSLASLRPFQNPRAHGVGRWIVPRVLESGRCTPGEYASRHRSLHFRYLDPATRWTAEAIADVHRYVNDSIPGRRADPQIRTRIKHAIAHEDRFGSRVAGIHPADRTAVEQSLNGKGRIDQIALTLTYAFTLGIATNVRAFEAAAPLGLDCIGFVNSYLRYVDPTWEPRDIPWFREGWNRRTARSQVQPLDVLIWEDHRHIAIVDSVLEVGRRLRIVESAGSALPDLPDGGLGECVYELIREPRDGVFSVDRGERGGESNVRISGSGSSASA